MFALCGAAGAAVLLLGLAMVVTAILARNSAARQSTAVPATAAPIVETDTSASPIASAAPRQSIADQSSAPSLASGNAPSAATRQPGVFSIGPGMYELRIPGAELVEVYKPSTSAGLMISGGARLPNNLGAVEIRERMGEFRAGNTAPLGDVLVAWTLFIKALPTEPGPVRNPATSTVTINGLPGIVMDRPGVERIWAFTFVDHTLMISVTGPKERIYSAEIERIVQSLRRVGGVPPEFAAQARPALEP